MAAVIKPGQPAAPAGQRDLPVMLMVAGFGDNASMFSALLDTSLSTYVQLCPVNLPGFGAPALPGVTSLDALGAWLADQARSHKARYIMGHSIASVIASIAASKLLGQIESVISLEGNLTEKDAYFSATAARYSSPQAFLDGFLPKLRKKAESDSIMARYAVEVAKADPKAMWELGCDAARLSPNRHPGDMLRDCSRAVYCYNPDNCAPESVAWLHNQPIDRILLPGASHWPSIDQPSALADQIRAHIFA